MTYSSTVSQPPDVAPKMTKAAPAESRTLVIICQKVVVTTSGTFATAQEHI